ncbi:DUF4166 domain-containing protein [Microbacterium lacticum]
MLGDRIDKLDVPFSVVNTAHADGSLRAARTVRFGARRRVMVDRMSVERRALVDRIGRRGGLEVALDVHVEGGALRLQSRRIALRLRRYPVSTNPAGMREFRSRSRVRVRSSRHTAEFVWRAQRPCGARARRAGPSGGRAPRAQPNPTPRTPAEICTTADASPQPVRRCADLRGCARRPARDRGARTTSS